MGSLVIRIMGFLRVNFQLLMTIHSRLRVRHGTDEQKDGHQCIMPPPYWGEAQ